MSEWYEETKEYIANNIRPNHKREITGAKMNTALNDIVDEVENKVDKVEGKGLSANDYTDTDKAKVASALQTETDPTVPSWAKAQTKPAYTASEVGAIPATDKGANGGVATLDNAGKVPQSQLPSYVDDVLEYANLASFPATGESGKIYMALDTNKTYRWSGSAYVEISQSLALGETSSTAFPGNRGKAIEDKIPSSASSSNKLATMEDVDGTDVFVEHSSLTDQQRNTALANVSNQTANSSTGKMGYKVLDPTKTFAEQVTAENTIYEIRDVFDLGGDGEEVYTSVPENITLNFNGGIIKNGILSLNNNCTILNGNFKSSNTLYTIYANGKSNIKIINTSIDGELTSSHGILFTECNNVNIEDCSIKNLKEIDFGTLGIWLRRTNNCTINRCVFDNIQGIPNGITGDTQGTARAILVQSSKTVSILNCGISNVLSTDDGDGIHIIDETFYEPLNVLIEGCRISNCTRRFIKVQAKGVVIRGNEMFCDNDFYLSFCIQGFYDDLTIENNIIQGITSTPIEIGSGAVNDIHNITICGNFIQANNSYDGAINVVDNIIDSVISNNYFTMPDGSNNTFLSLRKSADNIVVRSNKAYGCNYFLICNPTTSSTYNNIYVESNTSDAWFAFFCGTNESNLVFDRHAFTFKYNNWCPTDFSATNNQSNALYLNVTNHGDYRTKISCENNIDNPTYFIWNIRTSGPTNKRPSFLSSLSIGFEYFDETINKPIVWNGSGWFIPQEQMVIDAIPTPKSTNLVESGGVSSSINFDETVDVASLVSPNVFVTETNKWFLNNGNNVGKALSVAPNEYFRIKNNIVGKYVWYAFVKSLPDTSGSDVEFATGYSSRANLNPGSTIEVAAPSDAAYLWFATNTYGNDITPDIESIEVITLKQKIADIEQRIETLENA